MDIVLATGNRKKIEEMEKILSDMGVRDINIMTPGDFPDCPEVIEDGKTFEENAVKKAVHISRHTGLTAVADDSGLEVDALDGAPGVWSARYAGESANDRANLEKLLREMSHVPSEKRSARFVCCIAMASGEEVNTFLGYVEGSIGINPKGENGFGYDPVFYPAGSERTFAEMSDKEKNVISHRARALKGLLRYFKEGKNHSKKL